ncbi:DUF397 domain-containing protein [Streptomyces rubiginosohelvolus]|uniref:DUF397 domain-containing protein n=1 Tax=Streptomyces rubiginosohelvolus TaxID=67362 RepID=UPI00365EA40A
MGGDGPAPDNRRGQCSDPVPRDAKNPSGPALSHPGGPALALAADAFASFVAGVKAGGFDTTA